MIQKLWNKGCCKKTCSSLSLYMISLLCVIALMIMIFSFSAEPAAESSELSQGVTMHVLQEIQKEMPTVVTEENIVPLAELLETPIRKLAHFTEYAVLGFFVSLHLYSLKRWRIKLPYKTSVLVCMLYAISDEIHQLFVPGRAGKVFDVCVDTAGAGCGVLLFCLFFFIIERIRKQHIESLDAL